jgi:hypothetical protein
MFGNVAAILVSCFLAYVAWHQWQLAQHKLRLELFDRRYRVFQALRKFLSAILSHARFSDAELFEYYAGTSDAEFLFGADVVDYLSQVKGRALGMQLHQKLYAPLPVGEERSKHVAAEHVELLWLNDQLVEMTRVFRPYLSFSEIKAGKPLLSDGRSNS